MAGAVALTTTQPVVLGVCLRMVAQAALAGAELLLELLARLRVGAGAVVAATLPRATVAQVLSGA